MVTDSPRDVSIGAALQQRAARVIAPCVYGSPVGRVANPIMPMGTPTFFARAKGARLWDVDGQEYIDYLCALGPNLFGYGDPHVEAAAQRQRELGDTMVGPAPVMIDLAEKLVDTVSHADWAMFAKNGADVTSGALRIARAHTGKRYVLVATDSYHGTHAWCVPVVTGVLPEERAFRIEYRYNDIASLEAAVATAGNDLAAIFATAHKHDNFTDQEVPAAAYAHRCREICDKTGALLVVDDVRSGFRLARNCSWSLVGVEPDLSCWSKAIANGYALSALLGSDRARGGAAKVWLSGTYWMQAVPMAAAAATLELITSTDYLERTVALGQALRSGLDEAADANGFVLNQTGPVQMPMIQFKADPDLRLAMAFASRMIRKGIYLIPHHNLFICAALTMNDVGQTLDIASTVFADIARQDAEIEPHPEVVKLLHRAAVPTPARTASHAAPLAI